MSDSINQSRKKVGLRCEVFARFEDGAEHHFRSKLAISVKETAISFSLALNGLGRPQNL